MAATKTVTSVVEIIKIWNSASIKDKDVLKKLGMTKEMFVSKYKESNTMKSRCRNIRTSIVNLEALNKASAKKAAAPAPAKAATPKKAEAAKPAATKKSAPAKAAKATASQSIEEESSLSNLSTQQLATQIMEGDGRFTVYISKPNGQEVAYKWNDADDLRTKIALFSKDQKIFNTQPYLNGSPIPVDRIKDGDHIVVKTKEVGA